MYDLKRVPCLSDYPRNHCRRLATACLAWVHQSSELFICGQKKTRVHQFFFFFLSNIWSCLTNARLLEKKLGGKLQRRKHRLYQKFTNSFVPKDVSYFQGRIPSRCSHDRFSARASASSRPVGYTNSRCGSRFPASR
jgi:hypothetical protein